MTYTPNPILTAEITLPAELAALTEKLAESIHDNWAARRIKDGWKYGSVRSDAAKEHPCLVPYSELPESEKEYDRITTTETLKAILVLGYSIK